MAVCMHKLSISDPISSFRGEHGFLSNFYNAPIVYEGKTYPTSEHLYQALKTLDPEEREKVRLAPDPSKAKKMGKLITVRSDWDEVKQGLMRMIVGEKFTQHPELSQKLIQTGNRPLQETNWWGDTFWGVSSKTGVGQNILGKILEDIRDQIRMNYCDF